MSRAAVHIFLCLSLVLSRAAARVSPPPKPPRPSMKYVLALFGDSLTDTGNTWSAAKVPDSDFYWHGRYTDGPNWVDYLKSAISSKYDVQVLNYAWGAATACREPSIEAFYPFVKNVTGQELQFIADVASGKVPSGPYVKLVPVQWIGSNDVLFSLFRLKASSTAPSGTDILAIGATVVNSLITCRIAAARLLAGIPGVKDVVLVPLSPMHTSSAVPAALKPMAKQLGEEIAKYTAAAVAQLQAAMDAAKVGVTFHLLGDPSWIEQGMSTIRPSYKQANVSCFVNPVGALNPLPAGMKICESPTEYLFYDETHPETRFHQWFALNGFLPRMRALRLLP